MKGKNKDGFGIPFYHLELTIVTVDQERTGSRCFRPLPTATLAQKLEQFELIHWDLLGTGPFLLFFIT